ncbi:hypothetical protein X975_13150, partial [Stegodyphus mimosarum]
MATLRLYIISFTDQGLSLTLAFWGSCFGTTQELPCSQCIPLSIKTVWKDYLFDRQWTNNCFPRFRFRIPKKT